MRGTGYLGDIAGKAPIVHYLYYTLVLMKCVLTKREWCLLQAQALGKALAAIGRGKYLAR